MRIPRFVFLLAAGTVLAHAADDVTLSGRWQIRRSAAGNESQQDCSFTQKNSVLTGACESADRPTVQISGKVDGTKVTWTYKGESPGGVVSQFAQLPRCRSRYKGSEGKLHGDSARRRRTRHSNRKRNRRS